MILGFIPKPLFDAAPALRWVHCIASGMDMFLYPEMLASPVVLTGEKGLVGGHLADTGFGLLLALTRQIATAIRLGPEGWNRREAMRMVEIELEGLTMGVVGFGGTGRAMARRAVAFGMDVIACDVMPVAPSDGVAEVWTMDRLDELLRGERRRGDRRAADRRDEPPVRRRPLRRDAARRLAGQRDPWRDRRRRCARARPAIGALGGAALDVAPVEPLPPDHPLWTFDNVVMTPHTAGASQLRGPRNIARFCDNLRRAAAGEPLVGVVDKQLGY